MGNKQSTNKIDENEDIEINIEIRSNKLCLFLKHNALISCLITQAESLYMESFPNENPIKIDQIQTDDGVVCPPSYPVKRMLESHQFFRCIENISNSNDPNLTRTVTRRPTFERFETLNAMPSAPNIYEGETPSQNYNTDAYPIANSPMSYGQYYTPQSESPRYSNQVPPIITPTLSVTPSYPDGPSTGEKTPSPSMDNNSAPGYPLLSSSQSINRNMEQKNAPMNTGPILDNIRDYSLSSKFPISITTKQESNWMVPYPCFVENQGDIIYIILQRFVIGIEKKIKLYQLYYRYIFHTPESWKLLKSFEPLSYPAEAKMVAIFEPTIFSHGHSIELIVGLIGINSEISFSAVSSITLSNSKFSLRFIEKFDKKTIFGNSGVVKNIDSSTTFDHLRGMYFVEYCDIHRNEYYNFGKNQIYFVGNLDIKHSANEGNLLTAPGSTTLGNLPLSSPLLVVCSKTHPIQIITQVRGYKCWVDVDLSIIVQDIIEKIINIWTLLQPIKSHLHLQYQGQTLNKHNTFNSYTKLFGPNLSCLTLVLSFVDVPISFTFLTHEGKKKTESFLSSSLFSSLIPTFKSIDSSSFISCDYRSHFINDDQFIGQCYTCEDQYFIDSLDTDWVNPLLATFDSNMEIFVELSRFSISIPLFVHPDTTIQIVKLLLFFIHGGKMKNMKLNFKNNELKNSSTLKSYNIKDKDTIIFL